MAGLLYREDMDDLRRRMTKWFNGGDIGRPAMHVTAPREETLEDIPEVPCPPDVKAPGYTTKSFEFRLNNGLRGCLNRWYLAEAVPTASPDLAPNCLALYLGCEGVEDVGTVWCEPCIESPETAKFEYDENNKYWQFTLRLAKAFKEQGGGKFLQQFPDLIEGLDTLAAMRDTQKLLTDLIERPEWVRESLAKITQLYFVYYDRLYEIMKDEAGGSYFWAWAPGRMAKLQCDFSAMISPQMFGEFMVPVLEEMTRRLDYTMYHWDGPGAIPHHNHLLGLEHLDILQWTPGAGQPPTHDKTWWPMYHKSFEAGKKVVIDANSFDQLKALKKEFGEKCKQFLLGFSAESREQGEQAIRIMEF
jgi:5-methyltetrahydrofolate--homocysteine methyltransferase